MIAFPCAGPWSYDNGRVPRGYECGLCEATDCKLWRPAYCFESPFHLRCVRCALAAQKLPGPVDASGRHAHPELDTLTDTLGALVPAVPSINNVGCWPYTAVPATAVQWWASLPTYPPAIAQRCEGNRLVLTYQTPHHDLTLFATIGPEPPTSFVATSSLGPPPTPAIAAWLAGVYVQEPRDVTVVLENGRSFFSVEVASWAPLDALPTRPQGTTP